MSGSNEFDLPDVYRGFNFGFLPTAENIMTAKLFDFRDDVVFKAKVLDIQRKHLLAKQAIWQAINPSLYESDWVPNRLVTETSNNVNDAMISHARDFDGQILRQQWDKLLFFCASAQKLAEQGPYWFKETDMIKAASGEILCAMDGYDFLDLSCLKEVDPANQVSTWVVINKTALDMTAPGEKPLASKDTWDCYLNFSDETSKFYIPPALLYSTTPSEYHSNAIYQAMGIPSSWLQGGTQHLLQSALFMKPDEFPEAPWVLFAQLG
eukprot:jgi/Botrbrau1/19100/Bobra.0077s0014.1